MSVSLLQLFNAYSWLHPDFMHLASYYTRLHHWPLVEGACDVTGRGLKRRLPIGPCIPERLRDFELARLNMLKKRCHIVCLNKESRIKSD